MKIKIITIHRIPNFGSVFQCYALCMYLKKIGYDDVKVIDYNPVYFKNKSLKSKIGILLNFFKYKNREKKFNDFIKKNIPITEKKFNNFNDLKKHNFNSDLYIAGGDQLWNVYHNCGNDDSYKLTWTNGKKISYGTSLGQTYFSETEIKELAEKIKDFSAVSVRESSSVELLKKYNINAIHCVDPVFLLSPNEYNKFIKQVNQPKYLLIYLVTPSNLLNECVKKIKEKFNLKVILCSGFSKKCYCDEFLKDLGPDEILSYIKNATIILSSSFHATAFSTIFKKQFFTILPDKFTNERILDFLKLNNLDDRIITSTSEIDKKIDKIIDYDKNDYEKLIIKSKEFLKNNITE